MIFLLQLYHFDQLGMMLFFYYQYCLQHYNSMTSVTTAEVQVQVQAQAPALGCKMYKLSALAVHTSSRN